MPYELKGAELSELAWIVCTLLKRACEQKDKPDTC